MKYYLSSDIKSRKVRITAEEYGTLKWAKSVLTKALEFSENFSVVLVAYELFEKTCFEISFKRITRRDLNLYISGLDSHIKLNAAVLSYLSSARLFIDRVQPIFKKIISIEDYSAFKEKWHSIYDSSKEYQFIEALRNYAQHKGLPVHTLNYNSSLEDKKNLQGSDSVFNLNLFSDTKYLREDKFFKKSALKDLPENIDLIYSIRCHIEGLWQLHKSFLEDHGSVIEEARAKIECYREKYAEGDNVSVPDLSAVKELKENKIEKTSLFLDWEVARQDLVKRMASLKNLRKKYMSNKAFGN